MTRKKSLSPTSVRTSNFLFSIVAATVLLFSEASAQQAQLKGIVSDMQGYRISGATITAKGTNSSKSVATTEDGSFETVLEPGSYELSASAPGFCPGKRAPVVVTSAFALLPNISFDLIECALAHRISFTPGTSPKEFDSYEFPFREEILTSRYGLTGILHIRFGTKSRTEG